MPAKGWRKCPSCEDWYLPYDEPANTKKAKAAQREDWWANLTERTICSYCEESDNNSMSQITRCGPGGVKKIYFGDEQARDSEFYDDPPRWFWDIWPGKREYHRTDGWRGHYDTQFKGLEVVSEGWLTGWSEDWMTQKIAASQFIEELMSGKRVPPINVYILIEPTSNVFSMASTVLVEEGKLEEVKEWLEGEQMLNTLEEGLG